MTSVSGDSMCRMREIVCANSDTPHHIITASKELRIRNGIREIGSDDIEAKAFWWFVGHFDAILQDSHWEAFGRVAGDPQPEVWVSLVRVQFFTHLQRGRKGFRRRSAFKGHLHSEN